MNLHQCFLTKNECYQAGVKITPVGIMVHSTGANNPNLKRYVQPDDGLLGKNQYDNDWNRPRPGDQQVCVHAFIGKLADGTIATYQTLPWDIRGWHSGYANKSSTTNANKMGYIGFEICEDALSDPAYLTKVYREAVELVAYLCRMYNLDPLKDGVVICHSEGYARGIASNHGDVMHWWPRHGMSMDTFRADVAAELQDDADTEDRATFRKLFAEAMAAYNKDLQTNDSGEWSAQARQWCIDKGIFAGGGKDANGEPNYMWKSPLTREQAAMVLYRFAQVLGLE